MESWSAKAGESVLEAGLLDAIDVGLLVYDPRGALAYANAAARCLWPDPAPRLARPDAHASLTAWDAVYRDGRPCPQTAQPLSQVLQTGNPFAPTVLGFRVPGHSERQWRTVSARPEHGANDELQRIVVTLGPLPQGLVDPRAEPRDSQRCRSERQVEFERLTDAIPGVLFQLLVPRSAAPRFLFLSARTRELIGIDPADAVADAGPLLQRLHPDDAERALRDLRTADQGAVFEQELRTVSPTGDGQLRYLRVRAVSERRPQGRLWSGVVIDVTEERRLSDQLRHTQRREAMGDLAAGIAHNFNNMLAAMLPNLQEALSLASEEARPALQDAIRVSRDGADLVQQLLQTTRRDLQTRRQAVEVVRAVSEIAALCQRSFRGEVDVRTHFDSADAQVLARAGQLQQVLLNLCINARDAMQGCARRDLLLSMRLERATDQVVIGVRDTGTGMAPEVRARIGEPFFTTKPAGQGTGLGLATAFSIIDEIGGHIECRSELGHGTTFELHLPRLSEWQRNSLRPEPPCPAGFGGERVLVVDDDPLVRRAISRRLMRHGLQVEEAYDGPDALTRVRIAEQPFAAVLLDMSMPGMDGAETLAALQALDGRLPVIVMTGHVPDGARLDAASAVLIKPAEEPSLLRALDRAVRSRGPQDRPSLPSTG